MEEKKAFRRAALERRSLADPMEAPLCARRLAELPEFQAAEAVFCYASYGTELPTGPVIALARELGKRVAYPKVLDRETMKFYFAEMLQPGFRGIPEPVAGEEAVPRPGDLMLLPGAAFSLEGHRMGYGGGYYDRYLAALPCRPVCCGLCYELQLVQQLPHEPHDQIMDLLVTPQRIITIELRF